MFEKGSNLAKLWQVQILARISTLVVCFRSDFSMMVAYRLSERLTLDRVRGSIMFIMYVLKIPELILECTILKDFE